MRFLFPAALISLLAPSVQAFIGISIDLYKPSCAYACRAVIASASLQCPPPAGLQQRSSSTATSISPECYASSTPFLTTLAYCIREKCFSDDNGPSAATLENYWYASVTGDPAVPPKWGYQASLDQVGPKPTASYDLKTKSLNGTLLVPEAAWVKVKRDLEGFEWMQILNTRLSLSIFLVGAGMPIALTAITSLPFCSSLGGWVRLRFVFPTIGHRHVVPVLRLFHIPTLGQTLSIVSFTSIVLILGAMGLTPIGSASYPNTHIEPLGNIANRSGIFGVCLLPLTILFAGRNNVLLYLSNWSHSTYLLRHRWVARLCAFFIVLHAILEFLKIYNLGTYPATHLKDWWIWGTVGTVAAALLVLTAQIRRYKYDFFLITHILLVITFIVGAWYHLEYRCHRARGYEYWIYLCCGIWAFDRIIRLGRILKVGVKRADLTLIGEDIVRVDIPGVR